MNHKFSHQQETTMSDNLPRIRTLKQLSPISTSMKKILTPYPNPIKHTEKNANELTKSVIAFFRAYGGYSYRVNNVGVYDEKKKVFRGGTGIKGIPDVNAVLWGVAIQCEVKYKKDVMSDHQKLFRKNWEAANGVYFIARTFEQFTFDFWKWYDNDRPVLQLEMFAPDEKPLVVDRVTWLEIAKEMKLDVGDKLGLSSVFNETKQEKQAAIDANKDGLNAPSSKKITGFVDKMMDEVEKERTK